MSIQTAVVAQLSRARSLARESTVEFRLKLFVAEYNRENLEWTYYKRRSRANSATYKPRHAVVVEIICHCKTQQRRCEIHNDAG